MEWVKAEDARTAAVLEKDPRFSTLEAEALAVLESPDRLAAPQLRGGTVRRLKHRECLGLKGRESRVFLEYRRRPFVFRLHPLH